MARFSEIDQSKLPDYKYLGWGVDCRKSEEQWQQNLTSYDGPQIRALQVSGDGKNILIVPRNEVVKTDKSHIWHASGGAGAAAPVNICGEMSIGLSAEAKDTHHEYVEYTVFDTVTLQSDIHSDPDHVRVKYNGSKMFHSKFEEVLSASILDYVKDMQKKATENQVAVECLGKPVETLTGENAIAKLKDLMQDGKDKSGQILIADACTKFIDKLQYTHYVYSIKRGRQKTTKKYNKRRGVEAHAKGSLVKKLAGTADANASYSDHESDKEETEMGHESPEVIKMELKPLFTLIHEKSEHLRCIMEALWRKFDQLFMQGTLSGPFTISSQAEEGEKIYWCISHAKVNGTTDIMQASQFYIKCLQPNPPQFSIGCVHSKNVEYLVRFTEMSDSRQYLQVVETATLPDITFQLKNHLQKDIDLPKDQAGLVEQGRVFFQKCGGGGWLEWLLELVGFTKPRYIAMVECEDHQYKAMSCEKIDHKKTNLMLFSVNYTSIEIPSSTNLRPSSPACDDERAASSTNAAPDGVSKTTESSSHSITGGASKKMVMPTHVDTDSVSKRTAPSQPASDGEAKRMETSTGPASDGEAKRMEMSTRPASDGEAQEMSTRPASGGEAKRMETFTGPASDGEVQEMSTHPASDGEAKRMETSTGPASDGEAEEMSTRPASDGEAKRMETSTRPASDGEAQEMSHLASDGEAEKMSTRPASDGEAQEMSTHPASDGKVQEMSTRPASDGEAEETSTRPASDGEAKRMETFTGPASDGKAEETSTRPASDGEVQEMSTCPASDGEAKRMETSTRPASDGKVQEMSTRPASDGEAEEMSTRPASDGEAEETSTCPASDGQAKRMEMSTRPASDGKVQEMSTRPASDGEVQEMSTRPASDGEAEEMSFMEGEGEDLTPLISHSSALAVHSINPSSSWFLFSVSHLLPGILWLGVKMGIKKGIEYLTGMSALPLQLILESRGYTFPTTVSAAMLMRRKPPHKYM